MENEEWRDVVGYEGKLRVSSDGRLQRAGNARIWRGYIDSQGYYSVNVTKTKKSTVHRLVCTAFHGPPPDGKSQVAHWDGNKLNNNAENLRWVSHLENRQDGRRMHENCINEKSWKARLTREDVISIRREYEEMGGVRGAINQIAVRRGLRRWHVNRIIRRTLWANVT
jgi:hypothetical protein